MRYLYDTEMKYRCVSALQDRGNLQDTVCNKHETATREGGASSLEPRSRLFDFDIRYKTGGSCKTLSATRQGTATREGGASSMESMSKLFDNLTRDSYERRRSELNGTEEQPI